MRKIFILLLSFISIKALAYGDIYCEFDYSTIGSDSYRCSSGRDGSWNVTVPKTIISDDYLEDDEILDDTENKEPEDY